MTAIVRPLPSSALFVALVTSAAGCAEPPAEPEATPRAEHAPAVVPLALSVPERWIEVEKSDTAPRRRVWRIGRVGGDTSDVEVQLLFFGTGAQGDRDTHWDAWMGEFDGDPKATAKRREGSTKAGPYEAFEVEGTFKLDVGPKVRGRAAAQRILKDHVLLGAVIRTTDRGHWFLRAVGPRTTLETVRADFYRVLEGAR